MTSETFTSRSARAVALVVLSSTTAACGSVTVSRGPGPITSAEIATALTRPREDAEAPLAVRDTEGRPYALSVDEPVNAPTSPDGRVSVTTVRALLKECSDQADVCFRRRPFTIEVVPPATSASRESNASPVAAKIAAGTLLVGAIAGTGYCSYKCEEPWDTVVPVTAGSVLLATLVVGAVYWANSIRVR